MIGYGYNFGLVKQGKVDAVLKAPSRTCAECADVLLDREIPFTADHQNPMRKDTKRKSKKIEESGEQIYWDRRIEYSGYKKEHKNV